MKLAEASSLAVIGRLVPTPLPWIQWLIGENVQLVIGSFQVQFPARFLWVVFFSLQSLHQPMQCLCMEDSGCLVVVHSGENCFLDVSGCLVVVHSGENCFLDVSRP